MIAMPADFWDRVARFLASEIVSRQYPPPGMGDLIAAQRKYADLNRAQAEMPAMQSQTNSMFSQNATSGRGPHSETANGFAR